MNQHTKPQGRGKGLGRGNRNGNPLFRPNLNENTQASSSINNESNEFIKSKFESVESITDIIDSRTGFTPKPAKKFNLGIDFEILVNHFRLNLMKNLKIFQYDVAIKNSRGEEKLSNKLGRSMLVSLLEAYPNYKNKILFDFKKSLYCPEELTISEFDFKNSKDEVFKAIFEKAERSSELKLDTNQSGADIEQIKILQQILTQNMKLSGNYLNFGKKFYSLESKPKEIGFYLDEREGVSVSVRPSEKSLNVNINKTSVALNPEGHNLIDVICDFFECEYKSLQNILMDNRNQNDLCKWLKEIKLVNHQGKMIRVEEIFDKDANQFEFDLEGKQISVAEYFRNKYNIQLKFPNLPLLSISKRDKTPIEVCYTTLSRRENLSKEEQSNMIRNANISCLDRKKRILELVNQLNFNEDPYLKQYGINMDLEMVKLTAKKVKGAKIQYKNSEVETYNDGRWDNKNKIFFEPKSISNWIMIDFSDLSSENRSKFAKSFLKNAKIHSLAVNEPLKIEKFLENDPLKIENFISQKIKEFRVDFLMIINKNNNVIVYNILKKIGDIKYGIITQCVDESAIMKYNKKIKQVQFNPTIDQLCSNICLKINSKLGGINFKISDQDENYVKYLKDIIETDCMIFGIDVNHPTPVKQQKRDCKEEDKRKEKTDREIEYESVAAVVGRKSGLETVYHLNEPVFNLLLRYKKNNEGKWPKKLIFFRDGISEGQFKPVSEHELKEIREACRKAGPDCNPKISYIVVQKRHQTRMFPVKERDQVSEKNQNVKPGTIVDTVIVTPDKFDYFICSHLGIQGTSKPCHYYMLYDENGFDSNKLILLSFYLCHIYARSTTSVSYPAPTYYADLCAERGRIYPKDERKLPISSGDYETYMIDIHENLSEKMFYI